MLIGLPTPPSEPLELASHLHDIVLKNGKKYSPLRLDFMRAVGEADLSREQCRFLRRNASLTAARMVGPDPDSLWHIFTDYLTKRISMIDAITPERRIDALQDIIIFTRWNIDTFSLILDVAPVPDPKPYPARKTDVETFAYLLGYLQHSMLPRIKDHLERETGMEEAQLDTALAKKNLRLGRRKNMGIEIILPIEAQHWPPSVPAV